MAAAICLAGLALTVTLLPGPKRRSPEELTGQAYARAVPALQSAR